MLVYDVTYWRGETRLPEIDTNVSANYLETIAISLRPDESAYARCLNNPHEDRVVDRRGVHHTRRA
jgi:hypothetical protein